ncbi:MAG: hypothetical protein JWR12_3202 [Mucilaginibacter sp.]|nr:hypothetical protein [Mucilaginibacter sp.]
MKFYTLKVIDIKTETSDCATIIFKQPSLKRIKYSAGQYLSLVIRINGRRYIRPYSFSSAPNVEETLNITIKRVPGGIISNYVLDKIKVNDVIEVMEPMGSFALIDSVSYEENKIYLWGAGSGITPLISIAKYALHHHKANFVFLSYGNRRYENIIFRTEIAKLKQSFPGLFFAKHFLTHPYLDEHHPDIIEGRITADEVRSILTKNRNYSGKSFHYICGPIGLKESVKHVLEEFGVKSNCIFSEDFEVTRDPKEFENINTQKVLIRKDNISTKLEVVKGKSILEAGLDAFLDLSYSCQTGNCLVCKARIISGEVKMIGIEKRPELLKTNECLLCSSYPVSNDIEIIIE